MVAMYHRYIGTFGIVAQSDMSSRSDQPTSCWATVERNVCHKSAIKPRLFLWGGTISAANYYCLGEPPHFFSTRVYESLTLHFQRFPGIPSSEPLIDFKRHIFSHGNSGHGSQPCRYRCCARWACQASGRAKIWMVAPSDVNLGWFHPHENCN